MEVVQKQKKKKHEKKLVVKRTDFRPLPLSDESIAETKKALENTAAKEASIAKVAALKNELEAGIYGARDKLEREDIVKVSTEEQREELLSSCTEYEEWMYEGVSEKNEYENRLTK